MHVKKIFEKIYVLSATGSSFYLYSFTIIIFDIAKKEGLFCLKVLRHPPTPTPTHPHQVMWCPIIPIIM